MRMPARSLCLAATLLPILLIGACGESATLPVKAGTGPDPALPPPAPTLIPTVNIAPAVGWSEGAMPVAASGFTVNAFADGLDHPRWLHVLPNGDVLVAESNSQPRKPSGVRARIAAYFMNKAGAGVASADRISLLRDNDGDGIADERHVFASALRSPIGMVLVGNDFYVANTDGIVRFDYQEGATALVGEGEMLAQLPEGPINHHWTKNLVVSADGDTLYASVGSNSNVGENGLEAEQHRAAILAVDRLSGATRVFASGLRNPVGMDFQPDSGMLWTAVNERDELGSDLVPDYMTSVQEGGFYGWPWSYYGDNVDARVDPPRPDMVNRAIVPDYALGPHTASLGLTFYDGDALPTRYAHGAFIAQHGSWNRKPRSGYKLVFVPFDAAGQPAGDMEDVLTGFVDEDEQALGRPVDVTIATDGALLMTDDVGNMVWRISASQ